MNVSVAIPFHHGLFAHEVRTRTARYDQQHRLFLRVIAEAIKGAGRGEARRSARSRPSMDAASWIVIGRMIDDRKKTGRCILPDSERFRSG
jgi:hypothetical protein